MPRRIFHRDTARPGARECQICAREVMAKNGRIAHHGYERPGDGEIWHTCFGSRQKAYADANDALPGAIAAVDAMIAERRAYRAEVEAGTVALPSVFTPHKFSLHAADDPLYAMIQPYERDEMNSYYRDYPTRQKQMLVQVDQRIYELQRTRAEFEKRFADWHPGINEAVLPGMPL